MEKQLRTVVHLQINEDDHRYFGNVKALCDNVSYEILGASYNYIRNTLTKDNPLKTKTGCIIRKGVLIPSTKERSNIGD